MAIISFDQNEVPPVSKEDVAAMLAHPGPTAADLAEIPEMTPEELARMVPWKSRRKQTATV